MHFVYLPEHTLPASRLAIQLGADFIEPGLVQTRDGALVARHDVALSLSTNVADLPEFRAKRQRRRLGALVVDDWFIDDFSLTELPRLRAREEGLQRGRPVGLYPELKEPAWFRNRGLEPEQALLATLAGGGLAAPGALAAGSGNRAAEIDAALAQGMVAFFTDQPDVGRAVCDRRPSSSRASSSRGWAGAAAAPMRYYRGWRPLPSATPYVSRR